MVPVEVFAIVLWATFVFVGLSREFPRELGATIGFVTMMLVLDLGSERFGMLAQRGLTAAGFSPDLNLIKWAITTAIVTLSIILMYQGEGLIFGGRSAKGLLGSVFNLVIGVLNGWLVIGTWWYYTHQLGYPIVKLGWFTPPISAAAQRLVSMTPMAVIPDEQSGFYLTAFLIFLIVLKVAR